MRSISASEAKQNLAALLDAAQREPVLIRRHDREVAVVLSPQDYEQLRGANVAEFQRFCDTVAKGAVARGMTPEILDQLLSDEESPTADR